MTPAQIRRRRVALSTSLVVAAVLAACADPMLANKPSEPSLRESLPTPVSTPAGIPPPPVAAPMPTPASALVRSVTPPPRIGVMAERKAMIGVAPAPIVVAPPAADTAKYQAFDDNPWQRVAETPVSTFSASVDTGSYANVRRFINRGELPRRDAVRVEELVNYFSYDDAPPGQGSDTPFAVHLQMAASPWNPERGLLRIGIKGQDPAKTTLPPVNLVFLVDVSGSMGPVDRLPLVRSSLQLLVNQLREQDRVSLVTYANGTQVVLPATPGSEKTTIRQAIDRLTAGGGTAGEAGIRLAYQQAHAGFIKGGINRVLLATDGDLNIGVTDPAQLKTLVEGERNAGISLTTLGVGDSNYNEALMKRLANVGDGSYHYLDSLQEAHKVLVNQMTSTLATIAKDLKLQIEFNPAVADEYRLIGYELNALRREDFNNDQVDAGDIGAGHSVTALYEWVPKGQRGNVDPLRYQSQAPKPSADTPASARNELAWVKLRYKPVGRSDSVLREFPVALPAKLPAIDSAPTDLRFAAAVAAWGQWLRGSTLIGNYTPAAALALARSARGSDTFGRRAELERLIELSAALPGR